MSRSAGTLITTHNATFIPPRFMPGYRGNCPTTKFDYGETYGNATNKYFQDYRSEVLNASYDPYARGGDFPTYYSHKPESVISGRGRMHDRWLTAPKYELSNIDFDRKTELKSFNMLGQQHRELYSDKTGTKKCVDYYVIPTSAEEQIKHKAQFMVLATRHTDDINLPYLNHEARRSPLMKSLSTMSSQRDREIRDVHFEKR